MGAFEIPSLGMYAKETWAKWLGENPLYKTYPAIVNSLEIVFVAIQQRWFQSKSNPTAEYLANVNSLSIKSASASLAIISSLVNKNLSSNPNPVF